MAWPQKTNQILRRSPNHHEPTNHRDAENDGSLLSKHYCEANLSRNLFQLPTQRARRACTYARITFAWLRLQTRELTTWCRMWEVSSFEGCRDWGRLTSKHTQAAEVTRPWWRAHHADADSWSYQIDQANDYEWAECRSDSGECIFWRTGEGVSDSAKVGYFNDCRNWVESRWDAFIRTEA